MELPEGIGRLVSKSLSSEVKYIKKVNVERPTLWKIQDEMVDALKQSINAKGQAVSEKKPGAVTK